MDTWIKVARGIRYREHPDRKYGVPRRPDRYFVIRIAVDGVMRQEALGWESEGITLEKARIELAKLREAKRTGKRRRRISLTRAMFPLHSEQAKKLMVMRKADFVALDVETTNTGIPHPKGFLHKKNLWREPEVCRGKFQKILVTPRTRSIRFRFSFVYS